VTERTQIALTAGFKSFVSGWDFLGISCNHLNS
jgi:hypothetical protein